MLETLATMGGKPKNSSVGKVISDPEPTMVLIVPAAKPARAMARASIGVIWREGSKPCAYDQGVKYLIAIILPPLGMLLVGRAGLALVCLILQITILGWPLAAIWAVLVVNNAEHDKRLQQALAQQKRS